MIECPICHVNNDDQTHFCTECGHRFPAPSIASSAPQVSYPPKPPTGIPERPNITPVVSQSASSSLNSSNSVNPINSPNSSDSSTSSTYMDNNNPNSPNPGNQDPPKRQRLHSPMLGGDDPDDDAYAQNNAPSNYGAPKAPKAKSGLLRSPLLGGGGNTSLDDDVEPAPNARPVKGGKPAGKPAHLRSPLLGGSADDEDDYEEDFPLRDKQDKHSDKTSFPHRRNTHIVDAPEPAPGSNTGSRPHLRSPLLQGDDEYDDGDNFNNHNHQNQAPQPAPAPQARPAKLHSPLFDKQVGGNFGYDYEEEDQAPVNNNPNALRSPLLAARSPMHQDVAPRNPAPPPPQPVVQPPLPQQSVAQSQPLPLAQPVSLPQFPNPRPLSIQPPAIGTPLPMTPAITPDMQQDEASDGIGHDSFGLSNNSFSNAGPLPVLNPMPGYSAGMPQPVAPLPEPTGFNAPAAPVLAPSIKEPPKPAHLPTPAPVGKVEPKLKSKLLGGSSDSSFDDDYDDDYKSAPPAAGRKRFGEDNHQNSYQPVRGGGGAPSGPIMVLVAPMVLAIIGKVFYLYSLATYNNQLFGNQYTMANEFSQLLAMLALLIFGMMGNKR